MRNPLYRLFQFGLVFFLLLGMERRAYAYADPGVGLAALQTASATLFAVIYFLRRRIKLFFQPKDKLPKQSKG